MVSATTLLYALYSGAIVILGCMVAFGIWWWLDQRRDWFLRINPASGSAKLSKMKSGRDAVEVKAPDGEEALVPIDGSKAFHMRSWRGGRLFLVDESKGVQLDPRSEVDGAPGFELKSILDARLGEQWFQAMADWRQQALQYLPMFMIATVAALGIIIWGLY